jgi:hypothetical protein
MRTAVAGDVGGQNGGEPALHQGVIVHSGFFCAIADLEGDTGIVAHPAEP